LGSLQALSGVYLTAPWGFEEQEDFLNAAALLDVSIEPLELLHSLKNIEVALGRTKSEQRWGPRIIDLDILTYGDRCIDSAELELPHPRMMERLFVLAPLAEIQPLYKQYLDSQELQGQAAERIAGPEALLTDEAGP
ncbi:MAG TPA: 2-amino-4-hydroxy-6-hydroxymethyldihydropteridine diphosphokinase, partial [Chroococcales cyanobacterium]